MSPRPNLKPFPVIKNRLMTGNIIGSPTNIEHLSFVGYDIAWTGAPVGTFSVQVSNTYSQDNLGNVINAGNWTTITMSTVITAAGSPGNGFADIDAISATWIRLVYNFVSGTGTLNATLSAKVA